jgi:hypothetical protein
MTRIEVRTGVTGYRDQLDRMRRYLARVLKHERQPYVSDYQDDVWSFFQACWHLKDWVRKDPLMDQTAKDRIKAAVEASPVLAIANDMANGTKHLGAHKPRAGASHAHTQIITSGPESRLESVIDVNGVYMLASVVAKACVAEWERILTAEGLPTEQMGT